MKKETKQKAIVQTWVTGKYGKPGEMLVELNEVVRFKNGNINKAATLRAGYTIIKTIKEPYGWGDRSYTISEFVD